LGSFRSGEPGRWVRSAQRGGWLVDWVRSVASRPFGFDRHNCLPDDPRRNLASFRSPSCGPFGFDRRVGGKRVANCLMRWSRPADLRIVQGGEHAGASGAYAHRSIAGRRRGPGDRLSPDPHRRDFAGHEGSASMSIAATGGLGLNRPIPRDSSTRSSSRNRDGRVKPPLAGSHRWA
jgi:hypothetical protein